MKSTNKRSKIKDDIEKFYNKTDLMKSLHIKWQKMNRINN